METYNNVVLPRILSLRNSVQVFGSALSSKVSCKNCCEKMRENCVKLVRHLSDEAAMHYLCIGCALIGKRFERFVYELITVEIMKFN